MSRRLDLDLAPPAPGGADPNAGRDAPDAALQAVSVDRNTTALWEAVLHDSPPLVEALLAAGASVRAPWRNALPPLRCALVNRKLSVVPMLLAFGAEVPERVDTIGWSGARLGRTAVVQ